MPEIRQVTTKNVHPSRPIIVVAEVETADGQHVEGVGCSNLTASRAEKKAIERARRKAEATELGYTINYARGWLISESHIGDTQLTYGGSWLDGAASFALVGNHVKIQATDGTASVDVSGKSFLSIGRALDSAVAKAEERTTRITG